MYLWRRLANLDWWTKHEAGLGRCAGSRLALIERSNRKRLQIEVTCRSRNDAEKLVKEFGGRVEKLGRDWLKLFAREQKSSPLKIGKRLIVVRSSGESARRCSVRCPQRKPHRRSRSGALRTAHATARQRTAGTLGKAPVLVIPAGMAFGTGDHATTAMSLRLLEQVTREWDPGWSLVDLGTGSGILALAARCFGARRVLAIDNDPTAISTAKANARLNKIGNVTFRVGDVRRWKFPHGIDIVTANLFSELLIEILPKLKSGRRLILSGVLRAQEEELSRALRRNKIDIIEVRRRGKWIAVLAKII